MDGASQQHAALSGLLDVLSITRAAADKPMSSKQTPHTSRKAACCALALSMFTGRSYREPLQHRWWRAISGQTAAVPTCCVDGV